jgi:TolB-like protein/Tfp pilus assembly protein PilF
LLLAACVAFAGGVLFWTLHRRPPVEEPIRSLAVLPLDDLSPGAKEDYFADGMTGELITELARLPGLRVVSRTSVMQDKGVRKPLRQIAEELQVDAIVEGDVVRSAGRVRITAQLIDARSDKHLWSRTFEGPMGDVLTLQDDVARDIALQTSSILNPTVEAGLTSAKHISPEAHDDYLRGLYFIQRRDGALAAAHLRKAIELAPEYGAAYAGLAEALVTEVLANGALGEELMPPALAAANRAIQLDPGNGASYTALGAIDVAYLWDWDGADRNLRRGMELSPSDANAQIWYAVYLTSIGNPAEAVIAMQRAVALDPLSFWVNRLLGSVLYYAGRYDESLAALNRAAELAPDNFQFVEGWNSMIYELRGRYSDALAADLRGAPELSPGERDSFRAAFDHGGWQGYQQARVKYLLPRAKTVCRMNSIALSYVRLENLPEAFRWFNRELDSHCGLTVFDLASDPRLNKIRADPRFDALLERAHLTPHFRR